MFRSRASRGCDVIVHLEAWDVPAQDRKVAEFESRGWVLTNMTHRWGVATLTFRRGA